MSDEKIEYIPIIDYNPIRSFSKFPPLFNEERKSIKGIKLLTEEGEEYSLDYFLKNKNRLEEGQVKVIKPKTKYSSVVIQNHRDKLKDMSIEQILINITDKYYNNVIEKKLDKTTILYKKLFILFAFRKGFNYQEIANFLDIHKGNIPKLMDSIRRDISKKMHRELYCKICDRLNLNYDWSKDLIFKLNGMKIINYLNK